MPKKKSSKKRGTPAARAMAKGMTKGLDYITGRTAGKSAKQWRKIATRAGLKFNTMKKIRNLKAKRRKKK